MASSVGTLEVDWLASPSAGARGPEDVGGLGQSVWVMVVVVVSAVAGSGVTTGGSSMPLTAGVISRSTNRARATIAAQPTTNMVMHDRLLVRGNGATRQRDLFEKTGHVTEMVAELARATASQGD